MSLEAVHMSPEVYYTCVMQALSIEKEEIMGLLFGTINDNVARILTIMVLPRSDKRKDRVEIAPDKLIEATMTAPILSKAIGEEVNVIGWYHSHPHITVEPSHVDLGTQLQLQKMDSNFVGLIISVFNTDRNLGQEIQITCFQTNPQNRDRKMIPLFIPAERNVTKWSLQLLPNIPTIFAEEELIMHDDMKKKTRHLARISNDSAYIMNLCNILTMSVNPLMLHFEQRIDAAKKRNQILRDECEALKLKINALAVDDSRF